MRWRPRRSVANKLLFANTVCQDAVCQYCLPILFANTACQYCLQILLANSNTACQYCLPILLPIQLLPIQLLPIQLLTDWRRPDPSQRLGKPRGRINSAQQKIANVRSFLRAADTSEGPEAASSAESALASADVLCAAVMASSRRSRCCRSRRARVPRPLLPARQWVFARDPKWTPSKRKEHSNPRRPSDPFPSLNPVLAGGRGGHHWTGLALSLD